MQHRVYFPRDTSAVFENFREVKASFSNEELSVFTAPQGVPVILIYINPQSVTSFGNFEKGVLVGMQTKSNITAFNKNFHVFGIQLKPYGVKQLFNLDAHLITNKYVNIEEFPIAQQLYEAAALIVSDKERSAIRIEQILNGMYLHPVSRETILFLERVKENPLASIGELIHNQGISERTLERKFKNEIGISPKKYIRISRIINITRNLNKKNEWMDIVADHNFTDQSHFIKEFKDIIQLTPVSFIQKGLLYSDQVPTPSSFD